ncbi:TMEM175 family protein [Kordia jejudonensis]|nr:TMEM175 family protein [Kordia jejudonensis]
MVLEFKEPEEATLDSLLKLTPVFISYLISFIYLEIY